jgi:hypothetical protein
VHFVHRQANTADNNNGTISRVAASARGSDRCCRDRHRSTPATRSDRRALPRRDHVQSTGRAAVFPPGSAALPPATRTHDK